MGMNYNVYEHEKMKLVREHHPDWIWNRGDTHIILGVPGSLEAFKTPVEPGNSFSPGPGTYGVSSWVFVDGALHAPEEKPLEELDWRFEEGFLPVLHSKWNADCIAVSSSLFTDGDVETSDYRDYFTVELTNTSTQVKDASLYLVIRSFGAAGGEIKELSSDLDKININGATLVYAGTPATGFGAVSNAETGEDISVYLKNGTLPSSTSVKDESTWASGALQYSIQLKPGQTAKFDFIFHLHAGHWMRKWLKAPQRPYDVAGIRLAHLRRWKELLKIRLDLPDRRFTDAFNCQLTHLYMFTVANSIRITPISYPLWWLRDGAYVMNALNRGGLHDFCERACMEIADRDAFGGFGSEGDGPSDGIWVLSEHYLLTGDKKFLKEIFPHIQRKAELIIKMRGTEKPIKEYTEYVIPKLMLEPNTDLMCLPAEDGLIIGRMDHHTPIMWINGFAYLALKRTALCARALGLDDSLYELEAEELKAAILKKSKEIFGQNDRDVNSAFWPAGWASREDPLIMGKFDEFWNKTRCPGGKHAPEPDWTYFEAGQAHNYMLAGKRDNAWVSIEWFLSHHTAPGLYTYPEAIDGNTALLWPRTRGWDDVNFVTPHGWTAAEVFLLLRDCLVREEDGGLVIGSGIPQSWLDKDFMAEGLPTHCGTISFWYNAAQKELAVEASEAAAGKIRHELPSAVKLTVQTRTGG
jgi:hypothetical protein